MAPEAASPEELLIRGHTRHPPLSRAGFLIRLAVWGVVVLVGAFFVLAVLNVYAPPPVQGWCNGLCPRFGM